VLITHETVAWNQAQCKPKLQNADSENYFQPEVRNNLIMSRYNGSHAALLHKIRSAAATADLKG